RAAASADRPRCVKGSSVISRTRRWRSSSQASLPQFVTPGAASFAILLALGLTFCLMTLTWLVAYAFVVARAGDVLRRSRVRRTIEGATGAVLIAFGVRVAATR